MRVLQPLHQDTRDLEGVLRGLPYRLSSCMHMVGKQRAPVAAGQEGGPQCPVTGELESMNACQEAERQQEEEPTRTEVRSPW